MSSPIKDAPLLSSPGLRGGLTKAQPEVPATMFPSDVDGEFHVVSHDDELRRPGGRHGCETSDVDLNPQRSAK